MLAWGGSDVGTPTTPRTGKRMTRSGDATMNIGTLGVAPGRGPLLCKGTIARDDGYPSTRPKETLLVDRWGRRKVPEKSGFGQSDLHRTGTPTSKRPATRCGEHATHDRNNVRDYFMNHPDRKHDFRIEKRIIPLDGGIARGANPMSTASHMSQYVVSPEAQRRHFNEKPDNNGFLRNQPEQSLSHNLQSCHTLSMGRRHAARTGSAPPGSAGNPSAASQRQVPSKRFYGSPARSQIASQAFSGGHAPPKHRDPSSKIGSTAWR